MKIICKKIFSILTLTTVILTVLAGCSVNEGPGSSATLNGKYFHVDEDGNIDCYLEFGSEESDTMVMYDENDDMLGYYKYEIAGKEIILNKVSAYGLSDDEVLSFSQNGKDIYIDELKFTKE